MTISDFLIQVEGLALKPYDIEGDISGVDTIGIGHKLTPQERKTGKIVIGRESVAWQSGITKDQAVRLLNQDLIAVRNCVQNNVFVLISETQKMALMSFVFNCGCGAFKRSTLLRVLNAGAPEQVPEQMRRWVHNGKNADGTPHRVKGLVARREKEIALWNTMTPEP